MPSTLRTAAILACFLIAAMPLSVAGGEPDKIVVQHILIAFKKSVPAKPIERSKQDARVLAGQLFDRALEGEDFGELVKEYTDDSFPGIMILTNTEAPRVAGGTPRSMVVGKFGDIAFRLDVGEIGMAKHHATLSPYGWHVIKRLE